MMPATPPAMAPPMNPIMEKIANTKIAMPMHLAHLTSLGSAGSLEHMVRVSEAAGAVD